MPTIALPPSTAARGRFDLPGYLARLPLFHAMEAPELQRLAEGCTLTRLARGDMVFRVGEPCEAFHVSITGQIKLFMISPSGAEKVLEIVAPGHSFAEALMFMGRPYIVNAQALTDGLLLSIRKQAVCGEIERDARFAMRMLAGISQRLHGLVRDVEAYALHSGMQRVIGYLLGDRMSDRLGALDDEDEDAAPVEMDASPRTVTLPVSKATIASRLSITPEYFSRVLHELEAAGLIAVDKREIRLLDPARLAGYPGGG